MYIREKFYNFFYVKLDIYALHPLFGVALVDALGTFLVNDILQLE